jgi:hypothetical protein
MYKYGFLIKKEENSEGKSLFFKQNQGITSFQSIENRKKRGC